MPLIVCSIHRPKEWVKITKYTEGCCPYKDNKVDKNLKKTITDFINTYPKEHSNCLEEDGGVKVAYDNLIYDIKNVVGLNNG